MVYQARKRRGHVTSRLPTTLLNWTITGREQSCLTVYDEGITGMSENVFVDFSADEGADVGTDDGTPVSEDYTVEGSKFTVKIHRVTIELNETKIADSGASDKAMHESSKRKILSD